MMLKVGQRVKIIDGDIGHIEAIDEEPLPNGERLFDVRLVTYDNVPSCCTSICIPESKLIPIPDKVIPVPKSREWKRQAKEFYDFVCIAINDTLNERK